MPEPKKLPRYLLTVQGEFAASHQLLHYQGKCERLHGHNFLVEAVFSGHSPAQDTGMVQDFGELKGALKKVLAVLDHQHLNDLPQLGGQSPSSENLARLIYNELKSIHNGPAAIYSVTVHESRTSKVTYLED